MKSVILALTLVLVSGVAEAKGGRTYYQASSDSKTGYGPYQVNFDGNPIFNLYALCVNGDYVQSTFAYSNCKTWGSEGCVENEAPSFHPEKIARYAMLPKPGAVAGWEGDYSSDDLVRTYSPFPLNYRVTKVNLNNVSWEGDAEVLGHTTYTIPNCK